MPFAKQPDDLAGRRLAVSFHVAGDSGPMTWHAKALTTSYVTAPGAGAKGALEDEAAFPYTTASWFFLDAVEMMAPAGSICRHGVRRFHHGRHGVDHEWRRSMARRAVAPPEGTLWQQGRGGERRHRRQPDRRAAPTTVPTNRFPAAQPRSSGSSATCWRSPASLSLIWLEGINDFSKNGNAPVDRVIAAMKDGVAPAAREMA